MKKPPLTTKLGLTPFVLQFPNSVTLTARLPNHFITDFLNTLFSRVSVLCLIFLSLTANSQNQHTKWYFGKYAAIDFMTNPPTNILTSAMGYTSPAVYSEADDYGNLLFYTDGQTIWNQNNTVMANGTGLSGHWSSSQSSLIVKLPGSSNIYYVFTTDAAAPSGSGNGMRYSIVDMSMAAGMGSVTIKNSALLNPSSEKLCGVKHGNQQDVWIIAHSSNSNAFSAYLLSSGGVSAPVTSSTGAVYYNQQGFPAYNNNYGCMKASPMGTKLGVAIFNFGTSGPAYELYDFDPSTGIVSNALTLLQSNGVAGHYGCEFSPDGSKFYGTRPGNANVASAFYQWNLCAGSNTAIIASQYTAASDASQIQLAPDGKIYGSVSGQSSLCVINNPNATGVSCNYSVTGPFVSPNLCSLGLPNFVSYYKPTFTPITSSVGCQSVSFTSATSIISGCGPSTQTVNSCMWVFGDPASTSANTSILSNPVHVFSTLGTYTVAQVLYNYYQAPLDTVFHQVTITTPSFPATYSGFPLCSGSTLTLSVTAYNSYSWSTGANTSSIVVSPSQNTTYTVQGIDANSCVHTSVQSITVLPVPVLTIVGGSSVCAGGTVTQTATGAISYTWSTGANTASVSFSPAVSSVYTVSGTNANNCSSSLTTIVMVKPLPALTISGPTLICKNETALQTVTGALSYTWNTGSLTNTLLLSPLVSTQYTVTGMDSSGCINSAVRTLSVSECTALNEVSESSKVRLYPNPNPGTFFLSLKTGSSYYQLRVMDQLSKIVFEKKSVTDGEQLRLVLPPGNYLYIISDEREKKIRGILIIE